MCIHRQPTLADFLKILNGFKPGTLKGKYVIVCTKPEEEWRVAQFSAELNAELNAPLQYIDDTIFASVETAQQAVLELKARLGEA